MSDPIWWPKSEIQSDFSETWYTEIPRLLISNVISELLNSKCRIQHSGNSEILISNWILVKFCMRESPKSVISNMIPEYTIASFLFYLRIRIIFTLRRQRRSFKEQAIFTILNFPDFLALISARQQTKNISIRIL